MGKGKGVIGIAVCALNCLIINQFQMHLEVHGGKRVIPLIPLFKDKIFTDPTYSDDEMPEQETEEEHEDNYTECSKRCVISKRYIREKGREHKRPVNFLAGVCVDFTQAIFVIRRSFSGVSWPIHCQHSTYEEPSTARYCLRA